MEAETVQTIESPPGIYETPRSSPIGENYRNSTAQRKLFSSPNKKSENQLDNIVDTPVISNNVSQRILRSQSKNFRKLIESTPIK